MRSMLLIKSMLFVFGIGALVSCTGPTVTPERTYRVAHRQLPPDPTYSRLRWVHLPETHPAAELVRVSDAGRPKLLPVVLFSIKDKPLCDAALMIASLGRYSSYCSSLLSDQKITLETLGTMTEIAELLEAKYPVTVNIDHEGRSVRFLAKRPTPEQFFEEQVTP